MARIFLSLLLPCLFCCQKPSTQTSDWKGVVCKNTEGALIGTRFESYEALKRCIDIEYSEGRNSSVQVQHSSGGRTMMSELKDGVSEKDFEQAQQGSLWDKAKVALSSPYVLICRDDLIRINNLARRKAAIFGEGDISFYDLAQKMTAHIRKSEIDSIYRGDFSEKGFLNTFNHLTAQAFITTLFSERTADYVADIHELARLPELTTGKFSDAQINDLNNGPVDNYVDLMNNEWGQELGKGLKEKYEINRKTEWSPQLLASYLNEIQSYCAWGLKVSFEPFIPEEDIVIKFSAKLNTVTGNSSRRASLASR